MISRVKNLATKHALLQDICICKLVTFSTFIAIASLQIDIDIPISACAVMLILARILPLLAQLVVCYLQVRQKLKGAQFE